jgi:GAF domain-containing protein
MQSTLEPEYPGLAALLRSVLADMQRLSGADILSLFLYDEETRNYYAPFALGQPEETLLDSVADMRSQLERYLADVAEGKAPDELHVPQYGSTVWLTDTRRTLVARDAPSEIDSSFVRRYHVQSTIGLPLLSDDNLVGLVYLNYCLAAGREPSPESRLPDAEGMARLEQEAARAAHAIQHALAHAERAALRGLARLTPALASPPSGPDSAAAFRRQVSIALAELLLATGLDGAIVYEFATDRQRLELVTAHAPIAAPNRIKVADSLDAWEEVASATVARVATSAGLYPAGVFRLRSYGKTYGCMVVLSRDPLAPVRMAPATTVHLQTASDLIGGALARQRLIDDLESGNRFLGALTRMTDAMLRPGSSRQQVLEAVAAHLTDPRVPEFDFNFASVFLVEETKVGSSPLSPTLPHEGGGGDGDSGMVVRMAAGSAATEAIDALEVSGRPRGVRPQRVPRWALQQERALAATDVLSFVARDWQVTVVGELPRGEREEEPIAGYGPDQVYRFEVPVVRSDGTVVAKVPACLVEPAGGTPPAGDEAPFTLAGEIFETSGHGDLIRVFLPFGLDGGIAAGVLEVGYHRASGRRPDRMHVEALKAAAAQVAIAVETARLYEDARRHAEQLELSADVSRAIASSIDLDQALGLVARNLVRLVNASTCQIALYEEDGSGWFGAASSDQESLWRRQRGERPSRSFFFEVLDRREPMIVEDARASALVDRMYADAFGIRSLLALPLVAGNEPIGVAVLAQRDQVRAFTDEEVKLTRSLASQAAVAIKNAQLHALAEEEQHVQKDFVLLGFGQWGHKAYHHLLTLKQFFNFRIHVVERDAEDARQRLGDRVQEVIDHGDHFYWDSPQLPAREQLGRELESSCYVITYICTPAPTHLPTLARYYDLSHVVLIEKPLGAPLDSYRRFLDDAPGGVEIIAADHYYFKLEVRLLHLLLSEERTLRAFLDSVEEIQIEILEAQPLTGAAAQIGVIADLVPHAFAILSLFTPIDLIQLDAEEPLLIGRHEPSDGDRETYARLRASFPYHDRSVRLLIDVGKGAEDSKWIKLSGERRLGGRASFYKFDFAKGEAIDGTQTNVRAAVRQIREPGVPDNAHLSMLRHVIEKRHPAVGPLSIREAIRLNQRVQELQSMAGELLERGQCVAYPVGMRPNFQREPVVVEE